MKSILLLVLLSTSSLADNAHCLFKGEIIKVGESVWVEVPEYVNGLRKQMESKGYSKEAIKNEIQSSDHTGHRLYCTKAYKLANPKGKSASEILQISSYVMVDTNPYSVLNN